MQFSIVMKINLNNLYYQFSLAILDEPLKINSYKHVYILAVTIMCICPEQSTVE